MIPYLIPGENNAAYQALVEALGYQVELKDRLATAQTLEFLAALAQAWNQPEQAARLAGGANIIREEIEARPSIVEAAIISQRLDAGFQKLDPEQLANNWQAGKIAGPEGLLEEVKTWNIQKKD